MSKIKALARRLESGSGVLGLGLFLAALNWAGQFLYLRLDASEGKVYSLSKASKTIVKDLEDPVIVKAYFSKELPEPYATYQGYLKDLLRTYKNYGGRNFDYKFVSYPKDEDFKKEALQMGVAPVRLTYIARDKYEIKDGFMGLVLFHGDKKEAIPVIRGVTGLEYDLTSKIKKITTKEPRVVGFVRGKGERDLVPDLAQAINENYETRDIDLSRPVDAASSLKSLFALGPRESFKDAELARLEQIILSGVPTALFLDAKNVDVESGAFFARNLDTGLARLLEAWGLSLGRDLVMDAQNQPVTIQQQAGMFLINNVVSYPLMPIITNLSKTNPATKELDQIVTPYASAISISTNAAQGLKAEVLAQTSKISWTKSNLFNLSPLSDFEPAPGDPQGPFNVVVAVQGQFPVVFKEPPAEIAKSTTTASWIKEPTQSSRVLVVATSRIVDAQIPGPPSNQVFFLNTLDWLSQDSGLAAIRAKGVKLRPFNVLPSYAIKQVIKLAAIFLMPLVVVAWGLWRWRRRKAWKASVRGLILGQATAAA